MIKIIIEKDTQKDIEEMYFNDAKTRKTGIIYLLKNDKDARQILKDNCPVLYSELYEGDVLKSDALKKLLLANRIEMMEYIEKIGDMGGEEKKVDSLLKFVFRYESYASRKISYGILEKMNVSVCPYCNRQYIHTITKGRVRAQLDHYYPKSRYPYLALCLYNMIPSCGVCNMAKSSLDTYAEPILYPFEEEFGTHHNFGLKMKQKGNYVKLIQGVSDDFVIEINGDTIDKATQIKRQMEKLHLTELYQKHKDYVKDMIRNHWIYSQERQQELYREFPKLFTSIDEVKNMVYMTDIREEYWGKRPLSKLTHDIEQQLENGEIVLEKKVADYSL